MFAWGLTVAYAATGQSPFGAGPTDAILYRIMHEAPDVPAVPEPLRSLIAATLAKDPSTRPTASDILSQLAAASGQPADSAMSPTQTVLARTWQGPSAAGTPAGLVPRRKWSRDPFGPRVFSEVHHGLCAASRASSTVASSRTMILPDPPDFWSIIDEVVLRRLVGGPDVMRGQLDHLVEASRLPNVTLQVFPFAAGAQAALGDRFTILEFPGRPPGWPPGWCTRKALWAGSILSGPRTSSGISKYSTTFRRGHSARRSPGYSS